MPREASPSAMSLKGLFGPIVSSRSPGPDPCTSTTPAKGPAPVGTVNVPGSGHSVPAPMTTSVSVYAAGFAYEGSEDGVGAVTLAPGRKKSPEISPAGLNVVCTSIVAFANSQVVTTTRTSGRTTVVAVTMRLNAPTWVSSRTQVVARRSCGNAFFIVESNRPTAAP